LRRREGGVKRSGAKWKATDPDAPAASVKTAIRAELAASGLSQKDLAQRLGLTEKHISQVLTGKAVGSFDVLVRMAEAVGLTVSVERKAEQ
jgi:transcriptional regulator with XRE-family HTH domain